MCGIVGIVHRDPERPVAEALVRSMCAAIRHRGPDDEGVFIGDNAGLGMRRLSIIDLAGGHQPIFTEDRSRVIVYNGEIYNYRDLRRDLLARGHVLQTHSDTECIVHHYEDVGARCVDRLRGMFAFAVWDRAARSLFVARDRFGIKPLYYVEAEWGFAFASEMRVLVAAGLTAGHLDWNALDAYFQLGYIPAPLSPFTDIRKLPPAHSLEWDHVRGLRISRYWDLPRETAEVTPDLESRILATLDRSVAAHLESDVPVAAFLSGGLDSSAVVSSMAAAGAAPHAFTARYHGTGAAAADETGLARQLADRYGARLTIVDVQPAPSELIEPIVLALDEPHADESAVPTWLISQAVAREYKVALAGTGGDELFAGYRRHQALRLGDLYSRVPGALRGAASALVGALPEPRGAGLGLDRAKRFLRTGAGSVPERYLGYMSRLPDASRRGLYTPELAAAIRGDTADALFATLYEEGGRPHGVRAALYLDYKVYLADDLLALSDRISMAHSLEVRVPFVDHELVELVFPLPDRLKIRGRSLKPLLRRVLRSRLPDAHFHAPKRGFVGPTAAWLRHDLRDMLQDELSPSRIDRLGYFDSGSVTRLLREHIDGRQNREGILWALLCFSTWHRLALESRRTP